MSSSAAVEVTNAEVALDSTYMSMAAMATHAARAVQVMAAGSTSEVLTGPIRSADPLR